MDALLLTLLFLGLLVGAGAVVRKALSEAIPTRETVWDWESALLVEDGKIARRLPAGRHRVTPTPIFGSQRVILRLPAGEQTVTTSAQEVLTGDTLQVKAVGTLRYEVADPEAAVGGAAPSGALVGNSAGTVARVLDEMAYQDAQLALRQVLGTRRVEDALADRAALDGAFADELRSRLPRYGLTLLDASVRDVILGASLRRAFEQAETARLEAAAALERARGETAALRSLANAARLTRDNPALLSLRLIQTLEGDDGAKVTLVVGPDGLMSGLAHGLGSAGGGREDSGG